MLHSLTVSNIVLIERLTLSFDRGLTVLTGETGAGKSILLDALGLALGRRSWVAFSPAPPGGRRESVPDLGYGQTGGDVCAAPVPIAGSAGDQQAATFGQRCVTPGMAKNTYGTGSFVLMNVGDTCPAPVEGLLTTVAWTLDDGDWKTTYAYEGAIFVTGAAIQWLRDGLQIIDDAAETGPLAESIDDTGGVVFVPALAGLGSPYWDARARGTIVGITRGTGRAELVRATVEAMAYQTRDVVDAMAKASGTGVRDLRVDGGASVMDFLLQFQADQLGVPVIRSKVAETTALGSAYLAGLAEGVWDSPADVTENWAADGEFTPTTDRARPDADYARWQRAVERSRDWELEG